MSIGIPDLIEVIDDTLPSLYRIGVGKVAVWEIETETLKTMSDHGKGENKCTIIPWLVRAIELSLL